MKKMILCCLACLAFLTLFACNPQENEEKSVVELAMLAFDEMDAYRIKLDFEYKTALSSQTMFGTQDYVLFRNGAQKGAFVTDNGLSAYWSLFEIDNKAYNVFPGPQGFYKTPALDADLSKWDYHGFLPSIEGIAETYLSEMDRYLLELEANAASFMEEYPAFHLSMSNFPLAILNVMESPNLSDVMLSIKLFINPLEKRLERIEIDYTNYLERLYEPINDRTGALVPHFQYAKMTYTFLYDDYSHLKLESHDFILDDASRFVQIGPHHELVLGEWHETELQYLMDMDLFKVEIKDAGYYLFESTEGPVYNLIDPNQGITTYIEDGINYFFEPGIYFIRAHTFSSYIGFASVKLTQN